MDTSLISKFLVFLSKKSKDVFWIKDRNYEKQIYISPAYEVIWGRPAQELYDHPQTWSDYLHPEDREKMKISLAQRNAEISSDMQFKVEYRIFRPSGEIRYIQDHSFPIFDEKHLHIGFAGIARDITEEKQLSENLFKAKEAAEAANRAKTEFLANMSHDAKTPLTGIVGMADIARFDASAREIDRHRAEAIYACGMQVISFFNSCLELSKMEMENWITKTESFSLRDLSRSIDALFLPMAQTKQLSLLMEYDNHLPELVEGHRESIYRVLLNLVGNAIKFTHHGNVTIRFSLVAQHLNKIQLNLSVSDTGIGIPEDKYQAIFEKMRRLTPSYEGKIEGSGIGLYIVDQYVKRMGGEIKIESRLGVGSTFIITLPLTVPHNNFL